MVLPCNDQLNMFSFHLRRLGKLVIKQRLIRNGVYGTHNPGRGILNSRIWKDVSINSFISELKTYLRWYNEKWIKMNLEAMSPLE